MKRKKATEMKPLRSLLYDHKHTEEIRI